MKKLKVVVEIPDSGCKGCPYVTTTYMDNYQSAITTYYCSLFKTEIGRFVYGLDKTETFKLQRCLGCVCCEVRDD
jgi:hypothetical protein